MTLMDFYIIKKISHSCWGCTQHNVCYDWKSHFKILKTAIVSYDDLAESKTGLVVLCNFFLAMSSKCHILRILVSYSSTREFGICNLLSEIMNLQFTTKNTCTEMYSLLILFHAALSPCIIGITLVAKCSNTKKKRKKKRNLQLLIITTKQSKYPASNLWRMLGKLSKANESYVDLTHKLYLSLGKIFVCKDRQLATSRILNIFKVY